MLFALHQTSSASLSQADHHLCGHLVYDGSPLLVYLDLQGCVVTTCYLSKKQVCAVDTCYLPKKQGCVVDTCYLPKKQGCVVDTCYLPKKQGRVWSLPVICLKSKDVCGHCPLIA